MYSFLILSGLSGIIELGVVFLGVYLGLPIPTVISLPIFYQLGNILMNYLPRKQKLCGVLSVIAFILGVLLYGRYHYFPCAIQLVLSSYCIQMSRATQKRACPVWLKRVFRVGGFAISPIMLIGNGQAVLLICMVYCCILLIKLPGMSEPTQIKERKKLSLVMIFHQLHYFVYTYIMPIYVLRLTNSYILSGLAFAATWVVYLLPQTIVERLKIKQYSLIFFTCHSFLAVCMGMISYTSMHDAMLAVLVLWLLTGLGGGSVFCIKHLAKHYSDLDMELSENIGHVLGPIVAVLLCYCFPEQEVTYLSMASCIFVVLALLSAIGLKVKGEKNEYQNY